MANWPPELLNQAYELATVPTDYRHNFVSQLLYPPTRHELKSHMIVEKAMSGEYFPARLEQMVRVDVFSNDGITLIRSYPLHIIGAIAAACELNIKEDLRNYQIGLDRLCWFYANMPTVIQLIQNPDAFNTEAHVWNILDYIQGGMLAAGYRIFVYYTQSAGYNRTLSSVRVNFKKNRQVNF